MTPIITSNASLKIYEETMNLRVSLQYYIVYIGNQAREDKSNEKHSDPWCLSLVSLRSTVEAEILQAYEKNNTYLLELKVAVWVDHLVFFIVKESEGDNCPENLEVTLKLYQKLKRHIRYL